MNGTLPFPGSLVWQTPDLQLGSHAFSYQGSQYDGLMHTHREYSIVTCINGSMMIHFEGSAELLAPGDTFVVNPGLAHRCTFGIGGKPSEGLTLLVTPQLLTALCFEMGSLQCEESAIPVFHRKRQDLELLLSARKIAAECTQMERGFHLIVELLARQMLIQVLRSWPRDLITQMHTPISPQLPWVYMHRATEYMNTYGKGEFRLSDLCQEIGLSASRFIPLFRNSARMSPHSYYNHLLVFKARQLLRAEGCTTKEIAYSLGFKNVSHFCSLYHKLTGASPQSEGDGSWAASVPEPAKKGN